MALSSGTRLGHFEITGPLGAGGMGEVYRAYDSRLNRTVAIKVLPAGAHTDAAARERFVREAHAISSLNHPHICTLYDVGQHEGIDFLVMEFVDGETLAARVSRGPLPLPLALRYAIELASALDRAHRAGIVHRDIKPGNVMVTREGTKLLDFGLAKPASSSLSGARQEAGSELTQSGLIVGTLQYMAPEQIDGAPADPRTDIFSFGVVLYEMLSARKAFEGSTTGNLIAAIVEKDPPRLSTIQPLVPEALDRLVATCLAKDPDDRWQSARDLLRELRWIATASPGPAVVAPISERRAVTADGRRQLARILWSIGWVAAAALTVWLWLAPAADADRVVVLDVAPPPNTSLLTTSASIPAAQFAVSPNGAYVAFVAAGLNGQPLLWLRELSTGVTRRLNGTEGASYPFWSTDSASIGFFAAGQLLRLGLEGSSPIRVCQAIDARGGTWNADNVIVFALSQGTLLRVSASGGTPQPVTAFDATRGEVTHRWPSFLPDGKSLLYLARGTQSALKIVSLDGGTPRIVVDTIFGGFVDSSGHLLFHRDRALLAQPLDLHRFELSGDPVVIAPIVGTSSVGQLAASASANGVLVFATDMTAPGQLTWFDRAGNVTGIVGPLADNMDFELSPDNQRLAVSRVDTGKSTSDVWLTDLVRRTEARLTDDPGIDASVIWDPTGTRVALRSNRGGVADTYLKEIGSSESERLLFRGVSTNPTSWSPDGRRLLYNESHAETGWNIRQFVFDVNATEPFMESGANELHGRFSPDGRWVAFSSDQSGRWEVYVQRADGRGERLMLSTGGGFEPRWRGDGKEIFYVTAERQIMAVDLTTGETIRPGTPRALIRAQIESLPVTSNVSSGYRRTYTVTSDGQRFLVNVLAREQNTQAMNVVLNWPALLQKVSRR